MSDGQSLHLEAQESVDDSRLAIVLRRRRLLKKRMKRLPAVLRWYDLWLCVYVLLNMLHIRT